MVLGNEGCAVAVRPTLSTLLAPANLKGEYPGLQPLPLGRSQPGKDDVYDCAGGLQEHPLPVKSAGR